MAVFKVGQRVRIVKVEGVRPDWLGREATITGAPFIGGMSGWTCYPLAIDEEPGKQALAEWKLAPLTDPGEERFLASLREPNILAPQELEWVKGGGVMSPLEIMGLLLAGSFGFAVAVAALWCVELLRS
jgi:hypothetical protein